MSITYRRGNLFDNLEKDCVLIHVVNDQNVIGGGFTAPLLQEWPVVGDCYHAWCEGRESEHLGDYRSNPAARAPEVGDCQSIQLLHDTGKGFVWMITVINMMAQTGRISASNPHPLKYDALRQCLEHVRWHVPVDKRIIAPLYGSQLAGGDWLKIAAMTDEILPYHDIVIYVLNDEDLPESLRGELQ